MRAHTRRRDSDIRQRSPQSVADAEVNGLLAVVSAQAVLAPVPCTQRGALTLTSVCRPVAMIMGFQHALAMLGGIVSVPLIVGGPFDANLTNDEKQYLISAGLISSGILSMIQIYRMPLGESGYFIGTGLVSVLGTSFTFVPIARSAIGFMKNEGLPQLWVLLQLFGSRGVLCVPVATPASSPIRCALLLKASAGRSPRCRQLAMRACARATSAVLIFHVCLCFCPLSHRSLWCAGVRRLPRHGRHLRAARDPALLRASRQPQVCAPDMRLCTRTPCLFPSP
jgi:hypothetical protein